MAAAVKTELDEQLAGGKKINFVSCCNSPGKKVGGEVELWFQLEPQLEEKDSSLTYRQKKGNKQGQDVRVSLAQIPALESDLNMAFAVSS